MNYLELHQICLDNYTLVASYCRTFYGKGGVCIFMHKNLRHTSTDLTKYCKDFEAYAIKTHLNSMKVCIIALYRAPSGNFDTFITKLEGVLKKLFVVTLDFIICGDLNINYIVNSNRKSQIETLLKTNNLTNVVNFPTRIHQHSVTLIDNIFY
jgi:exonuclease III